jgi:hypothetical protein
LTPFEKDIIMEFVKEDMEREMMIKKATMGL